MMQWSLLYTLCDCDDISAEDFSGRLATPRFSSWWFVLYSVSSLESVCSIQGFFLCLLPSYCCYGSFRSFGDSFLFRNVLDLFFMSSSCQFFVSVVLFVYLQRHTVGAEIKVPCVKNLELWNCLPLKPGVGQSIAMHASPTARKVSIVMSDNIYLPSPFTTFSKTVSPYFFKKK